MTEQRNRQTVERWIRALNTSDLELFHAQFHPDSVLEYAQSGERIVGEAHRRGVYGAFPQLPKVTLKQFRNSGDLVVVEATTVYGGTSYLSVFIFEMRDGRIARETAYWSEPFPPAAWRAPWVQPS